MEFHVSLFGLDLTPVCVFVLWFTPLSPRGRGVVHTFGITYSECCVFVGARNGGLMASGFNWNDRGRIVFNLHLCSVSGLCCCHIWCDMHSIWMGVCVPKVLWQCSHIICWRRQWHLQCIAARVCVNPYRNCTLRPVGLWQSGPVIAPGPYFGGSTTDCFLLWRAHANVPRKCELIYVRYEGRGGRLVWFWHWCPNVYVSAHIWTPKVSHILCNSWTQRGEKSDFYIYEVLTNRRTESDGWRLAQTEKKNCIWQSLCFSRIYNLLLSSAHSLERSKGVYWRPRNLWNLSFDTHLTQLKEASMGRRSAVGMWRITEGVTGGSWICNALKPVVVWRSLWLLFFISNARTYLDSQHAVSIWETLRGRARIALNEYVLKCICSVCLHVLGEGLCVYMLHSLPLPMNLHSFELSSEVCQSFCVHLAICCNWFMRGLYYFLLNIYNWREYVHYMPISLQHRCTWYDYNINIAS